MSNPIIDSLKIKGVLYDIGVSGEGLKTIVVPLKLFVVFKYSNDYPPITGGSYKDGVFTPPTGWTDSQIEYNKDFKRWMSIGVALGNSPDITWSKAIEYIDGATVDATKLIVDSQLKTMKDALDKLGSLPDKIRDLETLISLLNNVTIKGDEDNKSIVITTEKIEIPK